MIKIILLTMLTTTLFAYDAVIKDKYGRVVGYVDKSDKKQERVVDKFGRTEYYIVKEKKKVRKGE